MFKTKRFREREAQLKKALNEKRMESLWQKYVRDSLRKQPISDLHDHYDFHIHRKNRFKAIVTMVLNGNYQPTRPLRIRSEKSHGMSRHLVFLKPEDAIVLESIADFLVPIIKKAQPCDNSYFSRNHDQPKGPEDVDDSFGYPWWILWPQFQKRILQFAEHRKFTVVTDVATYYDTIDFVRLRNYVSSLGEFSEVFLDFLFFLFERFVWRPDYLPFPGRGLPQINLDAPRLVAHAYLFEIDRFLNEVTGGDFVRWLDDIDFGCNSFKDAQTILRDMDELLLSRGLHLNSSKTKILSKKEAFKYFQLRENRYLTVLQRRIKRRLKNSENVYWETKKLKARYYKFINSEKLGQWQKVVKRYFTLATLCRSSFLVKYSSDYLKNYSSLRSSIFNYFLSLGWSLDKEQILFEYIKIANDDESFMGAIDVLISWVPQNTIHYKNKMVNLAKSFDSNEPVRFYAALKILAKFGSPNDIEKFISTFIPVWKNNDWLARQVASIWPLLKKRGIKDTIKNIINSFGLSYARRVLDNYELISSNKRIVKRKVQPYIFALMKYNIFPIHKFLITMSVLTGTIPAGQKNYIREKLLALIEDPIYRYRIKKIQL